MTSMRVGFHGSTAYDPDEPPALRVPDGATIVFDTVDARAGALLDRAPGAFRLEPSTLDGNPVSGPVFIEGAEPGDAIRVEILGIRCGPTGWSGAHAHVGWLAGRPGVEPVGFIGELDRDRDRVLVRAGLELPLRPMVGCIGTAPAVRSPAAGAGAHGGNLDHPVIGVGAQVLLPVLVPGALLSIGDVHAVQGHGELSGVALEVPAEVTVRASLLRGLGITRPWVHRDGRIGVLAADETFESAAAAAVDEAVDRMGADAGLSPGEALATLSVCGDLTVGAAWGGGVVTVLIDAPDLFGVLAGAFVGDDARTPS